MALDAGSVYTILGGRFAGGGFKEFDAANKNAARIAAEAEGQIATSQGRMAKAQDATTASAGRSAAASENLARSHVRLRESIPLAAMTAGAKSYDQAGKNLQKLGQVATKGAAVGIVAVGAAAVYAATKATTFNREMLKITTQAGASTSEVKSMTAAVLAMAGTVPQGPQKLAEGLYHIESAGFRGSQALEMLKASAQGAALGNADLQATTQAMIAAMASNIKGVHGSADAMGQLNAIVGVGDMRMEQLAQAMATGILPTAHDAGLSLKDVGAALATVTDNATPANVTATRLRMTLALMAAPSKAATKQLEAIGLTSTSLAHDMRQPNGLLLAIEDLKHHLRDSGKSAEEQDAILSKVFGGGKSSAVIHTLISETDRLRNKYQELGAIDGPKRLAKSWAEFQKSNSATFGELKSGAEAFAITVGNVLLPSLAKMAKGAQHAFAGFVSSGGAAKLGAGITSGFETLGHVAGNVIGPLVGVAKALVDVGKAVGLGNAAELSGLVAAFIAFKGLTFIAPVLTAIAAGISEVGLAAATAPSIAAFGGDLVALAGGPVGAIVLALSLAAGAFVALNSGLGSSTSEAERNAAALQRDKEAVEKLSGATDGAAKAHFAAERATLQHKEANERLKQVEKEVADGQLKGASASNALLSARLGVAESANQESDARKKAAGELHKESAAAEKATDTISRRQAETFKQIDALERESDALGTRNRTLANGETAEQRLSALRRKYNQETREAAQANAEVAVSEESRRRIEAGRGAITAQNAVGVKQLQEQLFAAGAPKKVVTRYELDDQGAQAKLGQLAQQLSSLGQQQIVAKVLTTAPSASAALLALKAVMAGVPTSKVLHILHNAPSARSAIGQLHAAINAVPSSKSVHISTNAAAASSEVRGFIGTLSGVVGKTVNIIVNRVEKLSKTGHASGRRQGPAGAALVGEGGGPEYVIDSRTGQGGLVTSPTIIGLGADDYVVPLEDQYRGRALGLFAMLARDLGVEGFKKGKHPKHRPVPGQLDPLSIPVADVESKYSAASSEYHKDTKHRASIEKQIRTAERTLRFAAPKSKPRAQAHVDQLRNELSKVDPTLHKQKMDLLRSEVRQAKAYQAKIDHETSLANIAANDMRLADGRGDEGGYRAAKGKRSTALAALRDLIAQARTHVKIDSKYFDELTEKITSTEVEQQTTAGEEPSSEEQRTGMTPAEVAEEKRIERDIALAGLTPDLADDQAAGGQLVAFLERVLGEVQAEPGVRGGDEAIKNVADQLKTARSNLASLSASESSDAQAQLTQEKERRETAERTSQIAEGALAVFSGSGDIGAGARSAYAAAGAPHIVQNNYMLHPSDPSVLHTIGRAATAGIGYQGARRPVRVAVGP